MAQSGVANLLNLCSQAAIKKHRRDSACRFNPLKSNPSSFCNLIGQGLDIPRTSHWISHLAKIGFLLQQQLCVARHAPTKFLRFAKGCVKGERGNRGCSAKSCSKRGRGHSQQIDPGVTPSHHPLGNAHMKLDSLRRRGCTTRGHHGRPHSASSAKLGNSGEDICIHTQSYLYLTTGFINLEAGLGTCPQVGSTRSRHDSQFLNLAGSSLDIGRCVNGATANLRVGVVESCSQRAQFCERRL